MSKYVGINVKISVLFIILIVTLILTSSGVLYVEFSRIYRDRVMEDLNQIMKQDTINMNNLVASVDEATLALFTNKTISNLLSQNTSNYLLNYQYEQTIMDQLISAINIPLSQTLTAYGLTFFASNSVPLSTHLPTSDIGFNGIYNSSAVSKEAWFLQTVKLDGSIYWFRDPQFKNRLYVARLITDPSTGAHLGAVVLYFDSSQISLQLQPSLLTTSAQIMILNDSGKILYSQANASSVLVAKKEYSKTGNTSINDAYYVNYQNKRYIYSDHGLDNGWQLIELIPFSEITDRMAVVKYIIWTTTGLAILSGIALSLFLSIRISRPIRNLAHTMRGIENPTNLRVYIDHPTNDEVGILYESFNKMMTRINGLISEVYTSGIQKKEAEIKALQAQINPHFLYNTLDSVNWIALGMGADDIATMISSLADILRYSISDSDMLVPISEELEQVKNYIRVQSLCYDSRFDVEYQFDPNSLAFRTPKLIIQPLVENSIQHGIEQINRRGKIMIRGVVESESVILSVSDSGAKSDYHVLNDYLKGQRLVDKESHGYGIKNVDHRIKLLFGNDYGLRYGPSDDEGVTAIVTLPKVVQYWSEAVT